MLWLAGSQLTKDYELSSTTGEIDKPTITMIVFNSISYIVSCCCILLGVFVFIVVVVLAKQR